MTEGQSLAREGKPTVESPADPLAGKPHGPVHGRRTPVYRVHDDVQESVPLVVVHPGHHAECGAEPDAGGRVVEAGPQPCHDGRPDRLVAAVAGPEVGHRLDGIDLQRLFDHLIEVLLEGGNQNRPLLDGSTEQQHARSAE